MFWFYLAFYFSFGRHFMISGVLLRCAFSRESLLFFLPALHSLWNDAGSPHSGGFPAFAGSSFASAAHFCGSRVCWRLWRLGFVFITALIKPAVSFPCLGMTDPG